MLGISQDITNRASAGSISTEFYKAMPNTSESHHSFTNLPLEIQHQIFDSYFSIPWQVTKQHMQEQPDTTKHHDRWYFSIPMDLLLVNHHFNHQAKASVARSRTGIYRETNHHTWMHSSFFDPGITTIDMLPWSGLSLSRLKERFPNLRWIRSKPSKPLTKFFHRTRAAYHRKPLVDILRGDYDEEAAARTQETFWSLRKVSVRNVDHVGLCGLTLTFTMVITESQLQFLSCEHESDLIEMTVDFEIDDSTTCVSKKRVRLRSVPDKEIDVDVVLRSLEACEGT